MRPVGENTAAARQGGFSLVELIMGMIAAACLALTAGAMLWYGYLGWRRTGEQVAAQRDMRAAMDVLTRSLRMGSSATFTTGGVLTVQFSDRPTATVSASGSNLVYRPDITTANQATLVNGTLQRFDVALAGSVATVTLVLRLDPGGLSNRVTITRRN